MREATVAAAQSPNPKQPKQDFWDANKQGQFVTALCAGRDGSLWVGTEDRGVWRYDPAEDNRAKAWTQFTRKSTGGKPETSGPVLTNGTSNENSLGDDNAYALACDELGRIWVGHLNHGVSVYNGQSWRNFDVLSGPLGERVFDIETCPTDGDVWIATSAGLARYSLRHDAWFYLTRADGLPSDQIQAMAFDRRGTLYLATQCDGLAIAPRGVDGQYRRFQTIEGLEKLPDAPTGAGLSSRLLNDVLVAQDGAVYAATTAGLAVSRDLGRSWRFTRGKDWEAKVKGLWAPTKPRWTCRPEELILAEDYVTCLAEDAEGKLWIGQRQKAVACFDPAGKKAVSVKIDAAGQDAPDFVTAILPMPNDPAVMLLGTYGHGVLTARPAGWHSPEPPAKGVANLRDTQPRPSQAQRLATLRAEKKFYDPLANPPLPLPAAPPSVTELNALLARLPSTPTTLTASVRTPSEAAYLGDDWTTWGDWIGRYGRQHNILCGAFSPFDHKLVWETHHSIIGQIDPRDFHKGDSLRAWVHWVATPNQRTLYDPIAGVRRQSEWDDHGERYPMDRQGPDVHIWIRVPDGTHRISAYFFNKDGHTRKNRFRDYAMSLYRKADAQPAILQTGDRFQEFVLKMYGDEPWKGSHVLQLLGTARVRDFWGGVYKQFVVRGPGAFLLRIERNHSHNAIVSAVLIDKLAGPESYYDNLAIAWLGGIKFRAPEPEPPDAREPPELVQARLLWEAALSARANPAHAAQARVCQLFAYRAAASAGAKPQLLQNWRWILGLWTASDREQFARTMDKGWEVEAERCPELIWQRVRRPLSKQTPEGP